jgi:5-formyltetrahydrofolate cyclo-ligase
MLTKKSLRQVIKAKLEAQDPSECSQKSLIIQKKLFDLPVIKRTRSIAFFVSLPIEVNTVPMIGEALGLGKQVLVPLTDLEKRTLDFYRIRDMKKDLKPGVMGILEPDPKTGRPVAVDQIDCVVVPGLVFDKAFNRIGYGVGLYDRFLGRLAPGVAKIGLAFSFQMVPQVPYEDHDQRLDLVLTD